MKSANARKLNVVSSKKRTPKKTGQTRSNDYWSDLGRTVFRTVIVSVASTIITNQLEKRMDQQRKRAR